MSRLKSLVVFSALLYSVNAFALDAPAALVPAGLSPGDTFYVILAGSQTVPGNRTSAQYTGYAATVAALDTDTASIAGWSTLFSHDDATRTMLNAFTDTNRPIYNTNGDKVADNRADMYDGTLDNAIGYDESGATVAAGVWTGFNEDGSTAGGNDDTLGGADVAFDGCRAGTSSAATLNWARNSLSGGVNCGGVQFRLYVLSPLLTVPSPVSGSASGLDW